MDVNMVDQKALYLIAVDIGTTHVKSILYRHGTGLIHQDSQSYPTYYPLPGYVEQNPEEIFTAVINGLQNLINKAQIPPQSIAGIVFGGIVQSMVPVGQDGIALCPSFTWADTRSIGQNAQLKKQLNTEEVRQRTGCTLHPMYYLSRLAWIRDKQPEILKNATRFISIKEYILERLFSVQQIDHSVASGTGIWNMHTKTWDEDLLREIGFSSNKFSECVEPISQLPKGLRKKYADYLGLLEGTPGIIGAYDGALSHFGSLGLIDNQMSLTVGTGAAIRRRITAPRVIPGTEAWCYYLAENNWLLGGVLHDAGNVMHWFAENLMPEVDPSNAFERMNQLAKNINPGANGLFFIPQLGGERCPAYRPEATGVIKGLTFAHGRNHLIRAMMEGLAYNLFSIYRMLAPDLDPGLVVTGGILKSPTWLKIVANFFDKTLWLPAIDETSAWGGVMIGLRSLGVFSSLEEAQEYIRISGSQEPELQWKVTYKNLLNSYDQLYDDLNH
jgi:gluconokinase